MRSRVRGTGRAWLAGITVAFALASAASGCGQNEPKSTAPSAADQVKALNGSPPPLASLHKQANRLLPGGTDAFKSRLAELHGYPVVVNKWASWCGPCRAEFPFFQKESGRLGKRVAFLGVNSEDSDSQAKEFLGSFPVTYPSYIDPDQKVAALFKGTLAFPTTAYYDRRGKLAYVHQGVYSSLRDLQRDTERYALGSRA